MSIHNRGFASMDRRKQQTIARSGGKAAHAKGTAHEWTTEEAKAAGRKGGIERARRRREAQESAAREVRRDAEARLRAQGQVA